MPNPTESLEAVLSRAAEERLEAGWLFLATSEDLDLATESIVLPSSAVDEVAENDVGVPQAAMEAGCLVESLDSDTIVDLCNGARQLEDPPSTALLLEAFVYYWKFDAYLPYAGAPDPPPFEEIQAQADREFYEQMGEERPRTSCRKADCDRGTVNLSALCKKHHFEMVRGRACPFSD